MSKKFSLKGSAKAQKETGKEKLGVFQTPDRKLIELRASLNKSLIECCKSLKEKDPEEWKYQVKKTAKELLGIELQYAQFKIFEKGQGRNINFYLGILATILDKEGKVTIEMDKKGFCVNGNRG